MAKFPEPPGAAALAALGPECRVLAEGTLLWRVYFRAGRHPTTWRAFRTFGPTRGRFDHHQPPPRSQARQILYCAHQGATCLAEVFQDTRLLDRVRATPWLVGFRLVRDVNLLDLCGTWPTRAGASMALSTGPRPRARRWARAIYQAYPQLEGLAYPSSMHANQTTIALFERAADALAATPAFHRGLDDPGLLLALSEVAAKIGYGLR